MYRDPKSNFTCDENEVIRLGINKFHRQDDSYTHYDWETGYELNFGEFRAKAREFHAKIAEIIQEPEPEPAISNISTLNANDKLKQALSLNTKPLETKHEMPLTKHETEQIKHEPKHTGTKNSKFIGTYYHFSTSFTSSRQLALHLHISNATAISWAKNNKKGCRFEAK